ncbi:MAG: 30S ribosomal protein S2 [Bacteroidales bacterium]|uniref:30S ribosomal protein S2 n=1 Tax=Porphyromonas sp. TaxID=1924944 RepID=UPI0029776D58|nr:30S ribosomal protein S2 [Porphyromonas sp.]MDD7438306.1 30S ribosomal protein S2 [Bacteroidales bacterium]MDY3066731.1 30S ribosomal protein S2 [Porphyromonas sp.]
MSTKVTFDQLLEAGSHFGHLTRRWNPAMAPYIFMERNGIHIIDLHKTVAKVEEAAEAIKKMAQQGKTILFVGTKKQAKDVIAKHMQEAGMPYVTERWPGGMLTNFPTIRKTVSKMDSIDRMMTDGTFENLSKREKLQITRQREKLETNFGSIKNMKAIPSAIFVVDVCNEHIAIREAVRLGIPIFAMCDTNANPKDIDFVIPANDDATTSIDVIVGAMAEAIKEGSMERKIAVADEKAAAQQTEGESEGGEGRRRGGRGVRRERVKREDNDAMNARLAGKFASEDEDDK